MDTFQQDPTENADVLAALNAENAQLQADGIAAQQQAALIGAMLAPIVLVTLEEDLDRWNNQRRRAHRNQVPLSDHLFSLTTIVQADLTEQRREILTAHLTIRGIALRNYTFDLIRATFLELFCAPRSRAVQIHQSWQTVLAAEPGTADHKALASPRPPGRHSAASTSMPV